MAAKRSDTYHWFRSLATGTYALVAAVGETSVDAWDGIVDGLKESAQPTAPALPDQLDAASIPTERKVA